MTEYKEVAARRRKAHVVSLLLLFSLLFSHLTAPCAASGNPVPDDSTRPPPAISGTIGQERIPSQADVTVLIYHRFGEARYPTTNVSADRFREQLSYLKTNNYHVLSLADLVERLAKGGPLPNKTAVITIDDGYKSVYDTAWPALKSFGYPFTVFLYVKATDNGHWDYMTWDQVRELQAAGVDFQDHGYSHHHFGIRPVGMSDEEYRAWIRDDLATSSKIMMKQLGSRPKYFAAPYGEYNRDVVDVVRALGYRALFTQDPGSVGNHTDIFSIPREPILGIDWSTMDHFEMVLKRVDLPITHMEPAGGSLKKSAPARFGARLLFSDHYKPGTLGIYVSELGWHPADLHDGYVSIANTQPLKRQFNRVAVSGREKRSGKTAIRFWLLINETYSP